MHLFKFPFSNLPLSVYDSKQIVGQITYFKMIIINIISFSIKGVSYEKIKNHEKLEECRN